MLRYYLFHIILFFCISFLVWCDTYYITEFGNNNNDGSQTFPWREVRALHSKTFNPGDQILFECGGVYPGTATLYGSGSELNPILIQSYGSGDKPHLIGNINQSILLDISSIQNIKINNLHFSHSGLNGSIKHKYGINVSPNTVGEHNQYSFIGCDFSNIQGYDGQPANESDSTDHHTSVAINMNLLDNDINPRWFNNVEVKECTFSNIDGIGFWIKDSSCNISDFRRNGTEYKPSLNVIFENNYGTNCYRNLCRVNGTDGALIQFNVHDGTTEGSAIWPFNTKDTLVQYNLFMNLYRDVADAYVCHFDYNCEDTIMQYNVGYKVEGGLVEIISHSGYYGFQTGAIARYNLGVDVGFRNKNNSAGILLSGNVNEAKVYNNTCVFYQEPVYKSISFSNFGANQGPNANSNFKWPYNCKIYNNIFYATGPTYVNHNALQIGIDGFGNNSIGNELSNNLIYAPQGYSTSISPYKIRPLEAWNGQNADPNVVKQDPLMISPDSADFSELRGFKPSWNQIVDYIEDKFKIAFGSPAYNQGTVILDDDGTDLFSNMVNAGTNPSIGFHEYNQDLTGDFDQDKLPDW